jgi:hypothetical protein
MDPTAQTGGGVPYRLPRRWRARLARWERIAVERREELRAAVAPLGQLRVVAAPLVVRVRQAAAPVTARLRVTGAAALDRLSDNVVVDRLVDTQLRRAVPLLTERVLDEALRALAADPEPIRRIMREQRNSIAEDVVWRLRAASSAGDAKTARITRRLRRTPVAPDPVEPDQVPPR